MMMEVKRKVKNPNVNHVRIENHMTGAVSTQFAYWLMMVFVWSEALFIQEYIVCVSLIWFIIGHNYDFLFSKG